MRLFKALSVMKQCAPYIFTQPRRAGRRLLEGLPGRVYRPSTRRRSLPELGRENMFDRRRAVSWSVPG